MRMGYEVIEGREVEWDEYNFTKLNIPPDHPAGDTSLTSLPTCSSAPTHRRRRRGSWRRAGHRSE